MNQIDNKKNSTRLSAHFPLSYLRKLGDCTVRITTQVMFSYSLSPSHALLNKNYYSNQRESSFEFIASVCKRVSLCAQLSNVSQVTLYWQLQQVAESFQFHKTMRELSKPCRAIFYTFVPIVK